MEKEIFGVIVNMIKRHREDKEICRDGCYLIQSVLNNTSTCNSQNEINAQNEAIKVGALETIIDAIDTHNRDADICTECFKTLYFLTSRTKCEETKKAIDLMAENIKKVVETGTLESAIKTMNEHIQDMRICEWGCKILTNIASLGKKPSANNSYNNKRR